MLLGKIFESSVEVGPPTPEQELGGSERFVVTHFLKEKVKFKLQPDNASPKHIFRQLVPWPFIDLT